MKNHFSFRCLPERRRRRRQRRFENNGVRRPQRRRGRQAHVLRDGRRREAHAEPEVGGGVLSVGEKNTWSREREIESIGSPECRRPRRRLTLPTPLLSLPHSLSFSFQVFARHRPSLHRVLAWEDELFALVSLVLDRAALNASAASFAETLYALRRAPVDAAAAGGASRRPLTSREKRRTLAFLVLAPYLRSKMEALYMRNTRPAAAEAHADWRNAGIAGAEAEGGGWSPRVPLPLPPPPPPTANASNDGVGAGSSSILLSVSAANRARLARARQIAVHAFVRAYPALAAGLEGARFIYQASYLLGSPVTSSSSSNSPSSSSPALPPTSSAFFFSPSLHLLRQAVVRVSGPELAEAEAARAAARARALAAARRRGLFGGGNRSGGDLAAAPSSHSASAGGAALRVAALRAAWAVSDHSRSALILAVFGFKLLEWWYLSGEHRLGSASDRKALPPPPPPPAALPDPAEGVPLPEDPAVCPLCLRKRTNPALAVCSGYVFCYPCLHSFVLEKGVCPVTRLPCGIDGVRRLFQAS